MGKYFNFCLLAVLLLLSSCQEGSEAGNLLGQWRMVGSDSKYVSFSGSITVFRLIEGNRLNSEVYGTFHHTGDSLFVHCYSINGGGHDTLVVENSFGFKPFDNIRLKIDVLDDDHLTLSKDGQLWSFYKY